MWLQLLLIVFVLLALCFGMVLLFGAPYVPTLSRQVEIALQMANLQPGQVLLELGCGDGRMVAAAASRGIRVVAYELNPIMYWITWLRTRPYRRSVHLIWGNYWTDEWPKADVIYVFLLNRYMAKLEQKIIQRNYSCSLISFAFQIPGRRPDAVREGLFKYDFKRH